MTEQDNTYKGRPTVDGKYLRVQISLCVYRELTPNTYSCILRDTVGTNKPGVQMHMMTHVGDAAIDRGRSRCGQRFLYNCCDMGGGRFEQGDVMVMIDHDIAWPPGAIEYLATKAHEEQAIVGAIVSKRSQGEGCATKYTQKEVEVYGNRRKVLEFGKDLLIESEYVGAAFTAYPLNVMQDIHDNAEVPCLMNDGTWKTITMPMVIQGFKPFFLPLVAESSTQPGSFDYCSEDWALCARARALGHKTWATTKLVIQHWGMYPYTVDDGWNKPLLNPNPRPMEPDDDDV